MRNTKALVGAVIAGALVFGACSGGEPQSYSSPQAVASALTEAGVRCDGLTRARSSEKSSEVAAVGASANLVESSADCRMGEETARIFVFVDEAARDDWAAVAGTFGDKVVLGPQWAVTVPSATGAETVAEALDASID